MSAKLPPDCPHSASSARPLHPEVAAAAGLVAVEALERTQANPGKAAPAPQPPDNGKPKNEESFVSAGRTLHNELTYRGIDFLLNSAVGVATTYWTNRTESGEKYFGRPVTNFFKKMLSPVLKSEAALTEGARWGSMFTSIIVGGTTIILPMIAMENRKNKKAMIRFFDQKIYGEEVVQNDPKFEESYKEIDNEPKKNFSTGMTARIAVLVPMIAVTTFPEANKFMVKWLYEPVGKGSKWLCERTGIRPRKLMEQGRMEIADGDLSSAPKFVSDWDFIHRTVGFDLGLTFIYCYAHEAAYKTLAAMGFKKHENGEAKESAPSGEVAASPAASTHPTMPSGLRMLGRHTDRIASRAPVNTQAGPKKLTDYAHKAAEQEQFTAV